MTLFLAADQYSFADQARQMLQYPHMLTCALLDLHFLGKEMNREECKRELTGSLSRQELDMLGKLTLAKRQREWLGGRLAAKYAAALAGFPQSTMRWQDYTILADKNGRPFISFISDNTVHLVPDISISHSGMFAAAMAVHKGYGGIDIQKITPKVIKVQDRFCAAGEMKILQDSFSATPGEIVGPLTKLWAAKEALRKVARLRSLPGFLEMELTEITPPPLQDGSASHGFIFKTGPESSLVAVTDIDDYVLALTARSATRG